MQTPKHIQREVFGFLCDPENSIIAHDYDKICAVIVTVILYL